MVFENLFDKDLMLLSKITIPVAYNHNMAVWLLTLTESKACQVKETRYQ